MHISEIAVENFRLLRNVQLRLEKGSTLIIGRNNAGKTSLTELFRRLLNEKVPRFNLEDFSLGVHDDFWEALEDYSRNKDDGMARNLLPTMKVELTIDYSQNVDDFGPLCEFIVDLDPLCTIAKTIIRYELEAGKVEYLFKDLENKERQFVFAALRERIPNLYVSSIVAVDPNDSANQKELSFPHLRNLIQAGFINAQRSLDDISRGEKRVLGRILEALFSTAASENSEPNTQGIAESLRSAVMHVQEEIDTNFNEQLTKLLPTFAFFGYPGLSDPQLRTETVLEVTQLLSNHTTVGYEGANGIKLPESHNGLGPRNLIFILLKLFEFFRTFTASQPLAKVHLVFIEEPEAHLHPQMQTVFIRKLSEISEKFGKSYNKGVPWPVQFVVTTHSSYVANEANFDSMRYFRCQSSAEPRSFFETEIKDLQLGLSSEDPVNREFLHKYMTLTRCDLLFADRAILIEGPTERILMPKIIEKVDEAQPTGEKLSSQYISIMEVGGAYAHRFFNLLDFLKLRTLIITDIDAVDSETNGKKCRVSLGVRTSNQCINSWYDTSGNSKPTLHELHTKSDREKIARTRRIAFQVPHRDGDACGRSFEDAFILTNGELFGIESTDPTQRECLAWDKSIHVDKTDFAIRYAIEETNWTTPRYIDQGLRWLAKDVDTIPDDAIEDSVPGQSESMPETTISVQQESEQNREKRALEIVRGDDLR